jgi:hypothetical protein
LRFWNLPELLCIVTRPLCIRSNPHDLDCNWNKTIYSNLKISIKQIIIITNRERDGQMETKLFLFIIAFNCDTIMV